MDKLKLKVRLFTPIIFILLSTQKLNGDTCPCESPWEKLHDSTVSIFQKLFGTQKLSESEITSIGEEFKNKFCIEPVFILPTLHKIALGGMSKIFQHDEEAGGLYIPYAESILLSDDSMKGHTPTLSLTDESFVGIFVHELWHAYYDLMLPKNKKDEIEQTWKKYYRGINSKTSNRRALEFGDEAIGGYLGELTTRYIQCLNAFKRTNSLESNDCQSYMIVYYGDAVNLNSSGKAFKANYRLHGYSKGAPPRIFAPGISENEVKFAQEIAGGIFPDPKDLGSYFRNSNCTKN